MYIYSLEYYPLKEVIYFICSLTEHSLQLHPPSPIQYAILPPISWTFHYSLLLMTAFISSYIFYGYRNRWPGQ